MNKSHATVLVVEDETAVLRAVVRMLTAEGYDVRPAATGREAIAALQTDPRPDVVLSDLHLPDMNGVELVSAARRYAPDAVTIVMTARGSVTSAVETLRGGAFDYLLKPFDPNDLVVSAVERALAHKGLVLSNRMLKARLGETERLDDLVGSSAAMRRLASLIDTVGPTEASVLVTGESGTGKELVVRAIHKKSARHERRLVAINCGAFAESVLESELFGHERGAFTGAHTRRRGLFEEADGGTLFLDEIGELPLSVQVRLLRVLQEREVRPVGGNEARPVDIRIVAATHRDLRNEVACGRFRQDLFFRLNVVSLAVPPLRERLEDLPLLVDHFLRKHAARHRRSVRHIEAGALAVLRSNRWPGNVRELENTVERAVVLCRSETIAEQDLAPITPLDPAPGSPALSGGELPPFADAKQSFERDYLVRALASGGGAIAEAARLAGIDRSNFRRMLQRHGLSPESK